jgi:hypothetical protein
LAKILSETCCFCKQFSQAFGKKNGRTSHKPLENNEKYRRLYSGIHLLAMPEKKCCSFKLFKTTVGLGKGPTNLQIGWAFFGPWFTHQKTMQDSPENCLSTNNHLQKRF